MTPFPQSRNKHKGAVHHENRSFLQQSAGASDPRHHPVHDHGDYRFSGHPRWISFCFCGSRGCAAATGIGESPRTLCSLFRYVFHRRRPFPGASGFILEKRIPTRRGSSENWGFVGPTVQHRRGRVSRPSEFTDVYGAGRETRPLRCPYRQPAKFQFPGLLRETSKHSISYLVSYISYLISSAIFRSAAPVP